MFKVSCEELRWAVVDSGIDATHPAFQIRGEPLKTDHDSQGGWRSRVLETYDFTRLTGILREAEDAPADSPYRRIGAEAFDELHWRLASGQSFDWALVEPFLRIPHDGTYSPPLDEHGSHVAGILAADWRTTDEPGSGRSALTGVCPDLRLYDLRVLPRDGAGDEFTVLGALQFIRYMNRRSDTPRIHGVNLSLSLRHEVRSYACGRSPVCEECARLIASGVVVVVAAGNSGYSTPTAQELMEDYHSISVTDPGNSEAVITVGSTHREYPHTYGVSFFSSRGPTADGRLKPDLVAPGEGIESVVPNCDSKRMSGTSMAAPHVSGVAALLMAYHRHLIGYPSSVKQVLCRTATDLGRERSFQGAGLVDALRALQSL
jgi:subtilisin family serine protease